MTDMMTRNFFDVKGREKMRLLFIYAPKIAFDFFRIREQCAINVSFKKRCTSVEENITLYCWQRKHIALRCHRMSRHTHTRIYVYTIHTHVKHQLNEQIGVIRMRKRLAHLLQSRKSWQILLRGCTSRIPVGACIQQQQQEAVESRVCRAHHKIWCRSYVLSHTMIRDRLRPESIQRFRRDIPVSARGEEGLSLWLRNPANGSIIPRMYDSAMQAPDGPDIAFVVRYPGRRRERPIITKEV